MKPKKSIHNKSFIWSGINSQGTQTQGEISAVTLNHAKLKLSKQGFIVKNIHKKNILNLTWHPKKISSLEIMLFFRQLAILINSGVTVLQSCEILFQTQQNIEMQNIITALKINIAAGKGLSRGLRQYPQYFDNITCHLIQAGELSGTFAIMLARVASHKEKIHFFKNKIMQALLYPSIISIMAIIIYLIMLTIIVPRFTELFQNIHGSLPMMTLCVIYLSDSIRHYGWLIIFPILACIPLRSYFKNSLQLKLFFDEFIIKIPVLKTYLQKMFIANFARHLSILFSAGITILDAIKIITPTSSNAVYKQALLSLHNEISTGQQLHRAMQKNVLFSTLFVQMVKIGEEAGALEQMLEKIATIYEADIDHIIVKISHLLEPLIMVVLGVLIGGLVIAMYLPIFKLGTVL